MRVRAAIVAGVLAACSRHATAPADPCPALAARYEQARTALACTRDEECVEAPGVALRRPRRDGQMGWESPRACPSATRRESLAATTAAAAAFGAAECGAVAQPGSGCPSAFGHGTHVLCNAGRCETAF